MQRNSQKKAKKQRKKGTNNKWGKKRKMGKNSKMADLNTTMLIIPLSGMA